MIKYLSTKTYGHEQGFSCAFRQWRANHSHCSLIHGYALSFHFEFSAETLDERNWVQDFGGLKEVKAWLTHNFDHTYAAAEDDPHLPEYQKLHDLGILDLRVFPSVGCEKFAEMTFDFVNDWVNTASKGRVKLETVKVSEHSGNSASVTR